MAYTSDQLRALLDGDTVVTDDGEVHRLQGFNAPEMGHSRTSGLAEEPGARESTALTQDYFAQPGAAIHPTQERDAYYRMLSRGERPGQPSLAEEQLQRGLGRPMAPMSERERYAFSVGQRESVQPSTLEQAALNDRLRAQWRETVPNWANVKRGRKRSLSDAFGDSWDRGVDMLGEMTGGAELMAGQMTGIDALVDNGRERIERNRREIAMNPADIGTLANAHTVADRVRWGVEKLGEQGPNIAAMLGMAALTGGTGAGAARLATAALARENALMQGVGKGLAMAGKGLTRELGAAAAAGTMNIGESKLNLDEVDPNGDHNLLALVTGVAKSTLDVYALGQIPGSERILPGLAKWLGIAGPKAVTALRQVPMAMLRTALTEGGTEGVQGLLDEVAANVKYGREIDWKNVGESAAVGTLMGGVMGGVGGATNVGLHNLLKPAENAPTGDGTPPGTAGAPPTREQLTARLDALRGEFEEIGKTPEEGLTPEQEGRRNEILAEARAIRQQLGPKAPPGGTTREPDTDVAAQVAAAADPAHPKPAVFVAGDDPAARDLMQENGLRVVRLDDGTENGWFGTRDEGLLQRIAQDIDAEPGITVEELNRRYLHATPMPDNKAGGAVAQARDAAGNVITEASGTTTAEAAAAVAGTAAPDETIVTGTAIDAQARRAGEGAPVVTDPVTRAHAEESYATLEQEWLNATEEEREEIDRQIGRIDHSIYLYDRRAAQAAGGAPLTDEPRKKTYSLSNPTQEVEDIFTYTAQHGRKQPNIPKGSLTEAFVTRVRNLPWVRDHLLLAADDTSRVRVDPDDPSKGTISAKDENDKRVSMAYNEIVNHLMRVHGLTPETRWGNKAFATLLGGVLHNTPDHLLESLLRRANSNTRSALGAINRAKGASQNDAQAVGTRPSGVARSSDDGEGVAIAGLDEGIDSVNEDVDRQFEARDGVNERARDTDTPERLRYFTRVKRMARRLGIDLNAWGRSNARSFDDVEGRNVASDDGVHPLSLEFLDELEYAAQAQGDRRAVSLALQMRRQHEALWPPSEYKDGQDGARSPDDIRRERGRLVNGAFELTAEQQELGAALGAAFEAAGVALPTAFTKTRDMQRGQTNTGKDAAAPEQGGIIADDIWLIATHPMYVMAGALRVAAVVKDFVQLRAELHPGDKRKLSRDARKALNERAWVQYIERLKDTHPVGEFENRLNQPKNDEAAADLRAAAKGLRTNDASTDLRSHNPRPRKGESPGAFARRVAREEQAISNPLPLDAQGVDAQIAESAENPTAYEVAEAVEADAAAAALPAAMFGEGWELQSDIGAALTQMAADGRSAGAAALLFARNTEYGSFPHMLLKALAPLLNKVNLQIVPFDAPAFAEGPPTHAAHASKGGSGKTWGKYVLYTDTIWLRLAPEGRSMEGRREWTRLFIHEAVHAVTVRALANAAHPFARLTGELHALFKASLKRQPELFSGLRAGATDHALRGPHEMIAMAVESAEFATALNQIALPPALASRIRAQSTKGAGEARGSALAKAVTTVWQAIIDGIRRLLKLDSVDTLQGVTVSTVLDYIIRGAPQEAALPRAAPPAADAQQQATDTQEEDMPRSAGGTQSSIRVRAPRASEVVPIVAAIREAFGRVITPLLARGERGERGGIVVVPGLNEAIERFKKLTGRDLDLSAVPMSKKLKTLGVDPKTALGAWISSNEKLIKWNGKVTMEAVEQALQARVEWYKGLVTDPFDDSRLEFATIYPLFVPKTDMLGWAKQQYDIYADMPLAAVPDPIAERLDAFAAVADETSALHVIFGSNGISYFLAGALEYIDDQILRLQRSALAEDRAGLLAELDWMVAELPTSDPSRVTDTLTAEERGDVIAAWTDGSGKSFARVVTEVRRRNTAALLAQAEADNTVDVAREGDVTWYAFRRGRSPAALLRQMAYRNWCTSYMDSMAESQLAAGDFYIAYKNGAPRLAVRMRDDAVGEIQGPANNGVLPTDAAELLRSFAGIAAGGHDAAVEGYIKRTGGLQQRRAAAQPVEDQLRNLGFEVYGQDVIAGPGVLRLFTEGALENQLERALGYRAIRFLEQNLVHADTMHANNFPTGARRNDAPVQYPRLESIGTLRVFAIGTNEGVLVRGVKSVGTLRVGATDYGNFDDAFTINLPDLEILGRIEAERQFRLVDGRTEASSHTDVYVIAHRIGDLRRHVAPSFERRAEGRMTMHADSPTPLTAGGHGVQGFHDQRSGLTFLLADALDEHTAPAVLAHEIVHAEQTSELDEAFMRRIKEREKTSGPVREVLDAAHTRMLAAGQAYNAAEAAPYIVEEVMLRGRQAGFSVADSKFMSWVDRVFGKAFGGMIRTFIGRVRAGLYRKGIMRADSLALDDLVQLVRLGLKNPRTDPVDGGGGPQLSIRSTAKAVGDTAKAAGNTARRVAQPVLTAPQGAKLKAIGEVIRAGAGHTKNWALDTFQAFLASDWQMRVALSKPLGAARADALADILYVRPGDRDADGKLKKPGVFNRTTKMHREFSARWQALIKRHGGEALAAAWGVIEQRNRMDAVYMAAVRKAKQRGEDAPVDTRPAVAFTNNPAASDIVHFFAELNQYIESRGVKGYQRTLSYYLPQVLDKNAVRGRKEAAVQALIGLEYFDDATGHVAKHDSTTALEYVDALLRDHAHGTNGDLPWAGSLRRRSLVDPRAGAVLREAGFMREDVGSMVEYYLSSVIKQAEFENTFGGYFSIPQIGPDGETDEYTDFRANDPVIIRTLRGLYGAEVTSRDFDPTGAVSPTAKRVFARAIRDGVIEESTENPELFRVWQRDKTFHEMFLTRDPAVNARVKLLFAGYMGNLGADMNPAWRRTQQWVMVMETITTLAFSTISSIPELAVIAAGAPDFKSAVKAMAALRNPRALMRLAERFSYAGEHAANIMLADTTQQLHMEGAPRKIVDAFFKLNGQHAWTQMLRGLAIHMFVGAVTDAVQGGNTKFLRELELTKAEVDDWIGAGMPAFKAPEDPREADTWQPHPVSVALSRFVDERVVMPSAPMLPAFFNDPKFAVIVQLKRFFYAFGGAVVARMARETGHRYKAAEAKGDSKTMASLRAAYPLMIYGGFAMGLAMLAGELKDWLKYGLFGEKAPDFDGDGLASWANIARKTGVLGPADLALGLFDEQSAGAVSLFGPAIGHLDVGLEHGFFSKEMLRRTTPVIGQLPGAWRE